MAKNKVKSGLVDIINGMKKDANAGSAWHVKRIAQLEAMLAAETGIEPTAAPEATAAPTIASVATTSLSAVIPPVSSAPPVPPISATAAAGPTAAASATSAATTARNTAATAAILTSMSKEALEEIDRQKKLDTIKAKKKREADDKLLEAFEKGQDAIQDALGGRKERKDLGTRIEDKKKSFKEFFTLRGFLNSTGMVKKDGGSLIDDMLGKREDKKNFENAQVYKSRADWKKSGSKEPFDEAGTRSASGKRFEWIEKEQSELARKNAEHEKRKQDGGLTDEDLPDDFKDLTHKAKRLVKVQNSKIVPSRTPKVKAPSTFEKTMKSVSESMSKVGNVFTKKPGNVGANMGTPSGPGGPVGSAMSSAMKSIASKPGSIGKSVMSSLSSGVGKTALQGVGKAAMGMMTGPAMAGIAAAAGPALAAAAPFVLGAAAIGVAGYGAYKAYKALTSKPDEPAEESKFERQVASQHANTSNKIKTALEAKQDRGETLSEGEQLALERNTKTVNDYKEKETARGITKAGGIENYNKEKKRENDAIEARLDGGQRAHDKLDAAMGKLPEAVKPTSASLIDSKSAENALAATEGKNTPNNVVVAPVTNNSVQNHPTTYKQLARNPDTTFTRHIDSRMSGAF